LSNGIFSVNVFFSARSVVFASALLFRVAARHGWIGSRTAKKSAIGGEHNFFCAFSFTFSKTGRDMETWLH